MAPKSTVNKTQTIGNSKSKFFNNNNEIVKEKRKDMGEPRLKEPGEENGNPLQHSCLENPMNKGAWQATVYEVARVEHNLVTKQRERLKETQGQTTNQKVQTFQIQTNAF